MLKLSKVSKFYGHFCALDSLSLNIEEGALYGFIGPNGAGKTTAIKIMTGIMYPDEGEVTINNMRMEDEPEQYKSMIGYVPDSFGMYNNIKVREYLQFFAACCGKDGMEADKLADRLLEYVELENRRDYYVEALSRGMKQKLALARALINDPPILIMDEPTSGLDPRTRFEFKEILGELSDNGKTILISSHILNDISELCTDIGIIDHGSIVMSGRLPNVMKLVTSENPIIISMAGKITQAIQFLKADNTVKSLTVKGSDIMINFDGSKKAEAELLKRMIEAGLPVRGFSREKGSLESIFMQLTGHGEEHVISSYDATVSDN